MEDLRLLLNNIWATLARSCNTREHPYRLPVLGTINGQYSCELRTVVLRDVDHSSHTLTFFTDLRSGKIKDLSLNPSLSWLFYDPQTQVQIRASGKPSILKDIIDIKKYWDKLPDTSKREYAHTQAPGCTLEKDNSAPSQLKTEESFKNFGVVTSKIISIDYLQLGSIQHQRALFEKEDGKWSMSWIVP